MLSLYSFKNVLHPESTNPTWDWHAAAFPSVSVVITIEKNVYISSFWIQIALLIALLINYFFKLKEVNTGM